MNAWNQPYPNTIADIIIKSDNLLTQFEARLNNTDCKKLHELYSRDKNNEICRNIELFNRLGYYPNSKLNSKSKNNDEITGIYAFGEYDPISSKVKPKYVGISRTVFRRL